jgi:hypothetical protein
MSISLHIGPWTVTILALATLIAAVVIAGYSARKRS